jgi:drug/metabolite transporter (DMT)-like permease
MDSVLPDILWFPLALGAALSFAAHNGFGKRVLKILSPFQLTFCSHLIFAATVTLVLLIHRAVFQEQLFVVKSGFWPAIIITSALNVIAYLLIFTGIRSSPLSVSVPYLSLTPVIIILTGWVLLRERVNLEGCLAIIAVASGSWLLHSEAGAGFAVFLRKILSEPGSKNLFFVAAIYSVSAVVDKVALIRSDILTFLFVATWTRVILMLPIFARSVKTSELRFMRVLAASMPVGLMLALEGFSHMSAISLGSVAYVIAVKRTSVLFSALLGFYYFGERKDRRIVGGILLMVGGAAALGILSN